MEIEHVARICLTSRRTTQNQRYLTVGNSLLRKVIVHNECRIATVAEVLAYGGSCERCVILHGSRVGSCSRYNDCVGHGAVLLEVLDKSGNGRSLLADGYIDTVYGLASLVETLLIDDCIDSDGSLTCLTVADDKLTLSTSDRNH